MTHRRYRALASAWNRIFWLVAAVATGASSWAAAQLPDSTRAAADARRHPIALHRLTGPIVLDGQVKEPAWDAIEPVEMAMFTPSFLGRLTEKTEIRIGYDDRFLYLSGRLYDSDPAGIRTNTLYRDVYSGDDLLAVVIDSYNDYQTAVWFVANPAGARTDRTMSDDAVIGVTMPMNPDWNAHWDVATSQDDKGWYAEFRIPFSTLRFQVVDQQVVMGLIAYRFIARKNERQTYPAIDPKWGGFAFAKPSQSQRVSLSGVRPSKPVYVTPYGLGGFRQTPVLRPGTVPAWASNSDGTGEAGLDVRYAPTSNLALDFTANTDFAQVEADDQQVNLTRFPLFFPEKRQFFQERASTFQFDGQGSNDRLFHSRRIGLDEGELIRIYGGGRAVGRIGGMDYGLLSMQTGPRRTGGSENVAVLRLNQRVFNPYSTVGGMVTSRLSGGGTNNVGYGLDAVIRPFGDEWITAKWAQTFDQGIRERSAWEAASVLARWERIRDAGLAYSAQFGRVGGDYEPGLGFQSRKNYRFLGGGLQYKRFQKAASPLRSVSFNLATGHYLRATDGAAESRSIDPAINLEFKQGHELSFSGRSAFESVGADFPVAGATVRAGDYWFHEGRVRLMLPRSDRFRGEFNGTVGGFYDGTRASLSLGPSWNPSKFLELVGGYEFNRISFADRQQATTAHVVRLKIQVALDTRVSFNTFAQYSNVADLATFNARFRYNLREGTDLWIVYNEGLNTNREITAQPRLPVSSGRALLVKYTHTLVW
ncbi:MAG: DUF5916 domain-containing protein [Gemmatimonadales bacterium]